MADCEDEMLDGNSLVLTVTKTDSDKRFNEETPPRDFVLSSRHMTRPNQGLFLDDKGGKERASERS